MPKRPAKGVIVLDCEAPHLEAPAFAAAAIVHDYATSRVTHTWVARCPPTEEYSPWVREHVLPVLDAPGTGIPTTLADYPDLLGAWREFYADYHKTHEVLVHVGWPAETRFLSDAHQGLVMGAGPYPLLDVATSLADAGRDPLSVHTYLWNRGIQIHGTPHHPLYDCRATLAAWLDLADARHQAIRRAAWHPMTWWRRSRCPHQDVTTGRGTLDTLHADHGQKLWICTTCGYVTSSSSSHRAAAASR
jgi:hypothetical protein